MVSRDLRLKHLRKPVAGALEVRLGARQPRRWAFAVEFVVVNPRYRHVGRNRKTRRDGGGICPYCAIVIGSENAAGLWLRLDRLQEPVVRKFGHVMP